MEEKIIEHLNNYNYDLRVSGDARFIDQKVTPDVLCIIADCVLRYTESDNNISFKTKDIWLSDYANQNVKDIFNKPDVMTETAKSEYDKFFQQPLKMLAYAKVLNCEKRGGKNIFKVNNRDLLNFISIKERNALFFIVKYLEKVLKDSDLWRIFENFLNLNDNNSFKSLKDGFHDFVYEYTAINNTNKYEPGRIFTKVINPVSYWYKKKGTKKGYISNDVIVYDELRYNRKNWRDEKKLKGETRQEFELRAKNKITRSREAFIAYAKEKIRSRHFPDSELQDQYAIGDATQVHHIFPKNEFPQLESTLENLILLTATQHNAYAHPENNTRYIDKDYQKACLLAKCFSVKKSIEVKDSFYSKIDFIYVLNEGISPEENFIDNSSFREIEEKIIFEYNLN